MFCKKQLQLFSIIVYYFYSSRMSWNIGDNTNPFVKLITKLGLYHVELRSKLKNFPGKITLTLVKTQQLPVIEKVDSKDEISCLKWTI